MRYLLYTVLGGVLAIAVILIGRAKAGTQLAAPIAADMAVGSDGALWLGGTLTPELVRIGPSGVRRTFALPRGGAEMDLTQGRDGTIWFTYEDPDSIGQITPSGHITWIRVPGRDPPLSLAITPDQTIWYSESGNDRIFRRSPTGHVTGFAITAAGHGPIDQLILGPDHTLWWGDNQDGLIGQITSAGHMRSYHLAHVPPASQSGLIPGPNSLVIGPDRALWFTDAYGIGRIAPDGRQRAYAVTPPGISTGALTVGSDGALWFTNANGFPWVGRLSLGGDVSRTSLSDANGVGVDDIIAWQGKVWAASNTEPAILGVST